MARIVADLEAVLTRIAAKEAVSTRILELIDGHEFRRDKRAAAGRSTTSSINAYPWFAATNAGA